MTDYSRSLKPGLLYLTYHENVLRTGILHTQVVGMLERLAGLGGLQKMVLLSFLSPQTLWNERKRIPSFRKRLAEQGVRTILLPMIIPAKWLYPWSLLIKFWALPTWVIAIATGCRIIHSRGYPAAMIAQLVAKYASLMTVFDPRGPYPAEMVMNSIWAKGSSTERFWSIQETRLIKTSDAVIGVTPEYRDEFRKRGSNRSIFVPNRTTTNTFIDAHKKRGVQRAEVINPELLFIGELHSVWNDPAVVARHFIGLSRRFPTARLRMITTANPAKASRILADLGVNLQQVTFESHRPEEMPNAMQRATFGLIFCAVNVHSLWSVKIAEYLAAGIPLIMDKSMIGLPRRIIQSKRLGIVVDPDNPADYDQFDQLLREWDDWSQRCIDYARRRLDLNSTARQHLRLYRSLSLQLNTTGYGLHP